MLGGEVVNGAMAYINEAKGAAAVLACVAGKKISRISIRDPDGDQMTIQFEDGAAIRLWDNGQDCCEDRYMNTDDDLAPFIGATLQSIEVRDGPDVKNSDSVVECQFLIVTTSMGAFTVANYNSHNGYYSGFGLACEAGP